MLTDATGAVIMCNDAARNNLNLSDEQPLLSDAAREHTIIDSAGTPIAPHTYPSSLVHATNRQVDEIIIGMRHNKTAHTTWFLANSRPLNKDGTQLALSTFVDITKHKELEDRLATDQRLLDTTLQHLDVSVVAVNAQGDIAFMNQAAMTLRRFTSTETPCIDRSQRNYRYHRIDGSEVAINDEPINAALRGIPITRETLIMRWPDQNDVYLAISATPMKLDNGTITGAVAVMHDITALKQAEHELEQLARRDPLTGLPNRRHFHEALNSAVARNHRQPGTFAVLFCDLDGFKTINDTHGHETGDELLKAVAKRLTKHTRTGDLVARIGGDEFVILAEPLAKPADAHDLAIRLQAALHEPFPLRHHTIYTGGSFGVAVSDQPVSADTLLATADRSMYDNKIRRRDQPNPLTTTITPPTPTAPQHPLDQEPTRHASTPGNRATNDSLEPIKPSL